jgi:hypothetical protein
MKATSVRLPTPQLAPRPDAIDLLEADHESARDLLEMLRRMTVGSLGRRRLVFVLTEDLWVHFQIEEEIFYPALARGGPRLSDGHQIRRAVKEGLLEMEQCPAEGFELAHLAKRVLALNDLESEHEERHVFPVARRVLAPSELVAIGDRLCARRKELRQSGRVRREISPVLASRGEVRLS